MFFKVISNEMRGLLDKLASNPDIYKNFYLAGGTALSLVIGHRKSFDFDFFTEEKFDKRIFESLKHEKNFKMIQENHDTLIALFDNIKISFFYYPYPRLKKGLKYMSLELASIEDIACMKIIAISQRSEKKDFFDLREILEIIEPTDLFRYLIKKYGKKQLNCYHILRSIFYFQDVENSTDPIILNERGWEEIKSYFLSKEKEFSKYFL